MMTSDHAGLKPDEVGTVAMGHTRNPLRAVAAWGRNTPQGKLVGQKAPFKLKEIWAIRVRLQLFRRVRDLALFDLGIDSKLRACDLVRLKVRDICHGDRVAARAIVMQQKTSRPVQFEITESTREAVAAWIKEAGLRSEDYLFPSRLHESLHLSTRQYAHIVDSWVEESDLILLTTGPTRCAARRHR
jgi:integrase